MTVNILHLYPELMNLYGEYGNVRMLQKVLSETGYEVKVSSVKAGESFNPDDYDVIYMGCGTEKASLKALEELRPYRKDIITYIENNKVLLLTGNSFEIFGNGITDDLLGNVEGLKLFGFGVERTHKKRYLGDAIFTCLQTEDKIIGFINKCSKVLGVSSPLFNVQRGLGNDNLKSTEGYTYKNVFATNLIGPLLVRNPYFCLYIVGVINDLKDFEPTGTPSLELEIKAYNAALTEMEALK